MKMPIQFDTLSYARKLEKAGIPRNQAEAHADALGEALAKSVVVPGDLALLGNQLGNRIDALDVRLSGRIDGLEIKLEALRTEMNEKFKLLYWILTFLLASHMAIVFKIFF